MPPYIVKVTQKNGDLLRPITAMASTEERAIALVRNCGVAETDDKVESKGIRDDVMKRAFGNQTGWHGCCARRLDMGWQ